MDVPSFTPESLSVKQKPLVWPAYARGYTGSLYIFPQITDPNIVKVGVLISIKNFSTP
jgi:hypothetical protein